MSVEDAALGALQVQKYGMTQAIELNSVRRGYDPREFTLVAGGGGGPMFACDIALELEIARVLVPPHPGIIAATGLLATDLQHEFVATERHQLKSLDGEKLAARFDELSGQALAQLEADGVPEDRRLIRRLADCRYAGQGYEVRTEVSDGRGRRCLGGGAQGALPRGARGRVRASLRRADRDHQHPRGGRSVASTSSRRPQLERGDGDPSRARTLEREVVFDVDGKAERHATPFYERARVACGRPARGPGDRRAVRHDDRDPARPRRRDRPVRQHRGRLHHAGEAGGGARGRAVDTDPDAGDRRRLRLDREGDGRRALPDELLLDHPRVGGSRGRHLRPRRERAGRVGLDADVHGRDAEDRQERHRDSRRTTSTTGT